jgi:hypothetical protein
LPEEVRQAKGAAEDAEGDGNKKKVEKKIERVTDHQFEMEADVDQKHREKQE